MTCVAYCLSVAARIAQNLLQITRVSADCCSFGCCFFIALYLSLRGDFRPFAIRRSTDPFIETQRRDEKHIKNFYMSWNHPKKLAWKTELESMGEIQAPRSRRWDDFGNFAGVSLFDDRTSRHRIANSPRKMTLHKNQQKASIGPLHFRQKYGSQNSEFAFWALSSRPSIQTQAGASYGYHDKTSVDGLGAACDNSLPLRSAPYPE